MKIPRFSYTSFIFLILFSFFFSCRKSSTSTILLHKAQNIIESNPSEALLLLDSIPNPDEMDKEDYMEYIVAKVQTKYKTYQDISNDTLIFDAQSYFEQKSNNKKAALANFYAAALFKERHKYDKALENFLKAEQYAKLAKDNLLRAKCLDNIGFLYFEQNIVDAAIISYKSALNYYNKYENTSLLQLQVINQIGRSFEALNKFDSAYNYFSKGLALSEQLDNFAYQSKFNHHIGVVYLNKQEYKQSESYLKKALSQASNSKDSISTYLNLSILYNNTKQIDSTRYYTNLIKERIAEIKDNYVLEYVYGSLFEYNKQIGNVNEALSYLELQNTVKENISKTYNSEKLLNTESKYKLYIQKQEQKAKRTQELLIQAIILLVIIAVYYFATTKRRNKYKQEKIRNQWLRAENRLLKQEYESHVYLESIYKEFILKWHQIENDLSKNGIEESPHVNNPLYYEIKPMIDDLKSKSNEQLVKMATKYFYSHNDSDIGDKAVRTLTEQELMLLMLCYLEYSQAAIATILDIRLERLNLEERKERIRARLQKIGMSDKDIDFLLHS